MDWANIAQFFFALIFVVSLMVLLAWAIRKSGWGGVAPLSNDRKKRLSISEYIPLDSRRKLVLIRRDNIEHLVITGPQGETVVEQNIKGKVSLDSTQDKTDTDKH